MPIVSHMERELTISQAREIGRLRGRHKGAEFLVHPKPWGLIIEARRGGHCVELTSFDWSGATSPEQRIPRR